MNIQRLAGNVAWISGAASGIGAATARLFAAEGARVALADVAAEKIRAIAAEINRFGGRALAIECDVRREDEVRAALNQTAAELGGLHIVVNSAGIVQIKHLHECTEEDWDTVMGVNVRGMFLAIKHAIPLLRVQKRSFVVNIGSISCFVGQACTPIYNASKHAVLGLTRSVALDYAKDGIRCNCVCPGVTDTPMLREHLGATAAAEAALAGRVRRVPIGVPLKPLDVARAIRYLSCEDSSGVTGTALTIDGGYLTAAEWDTQGHTAFMESP